MKINTEAVHRNLQKVERITQLLLELRNITPETSEKLDELNQLTQCDTNIDQLTVAYACSQYVYELMREQSKVLIVTQKNLAEKNQEVH